MRHLPRRGQIVAEEQTIRCRHLPVCPQIFQDTAMFRPAAPKVLQSAARPLAYTGPNIEEAVFQHVQGSPEVRLSSCPG